MNIDAQVKGESQVIARVNRIVPNVRSALVQRVQRLVISLQSYVVQNKLQGQVLKVRTGRLQRSINQAVTTTDTTVSGVVSTPVEYAAADEYGFQGVVTVKAHLRQVTMAFGKTLKTPVTANVSTHTMKMNLPERSFLRSALADQREEILRGIREATAEGAQR
ncbi:hypothetical protein [Burkholderia stagnalis]|uniref:hypothetical protein n=1 Tax=Burkholderia stagnalis TaxID=1503054 RepID=UPI001C8A00BB|nr:hypothetical protein [Burkholderia stagnalis]